MNKINLKNLLLQVVVVLLLIGCASHKQPKRHKAPKPGKPIPCPLKDC